METRSGASSLLRSPGDVALVERGSPRWIVFSCPCGCGEQLPINLDHRAGPAWRLYRGSRGVSVYPSVWRDTGCESHFIVWDDKYLVFERDRYPEEPPDREEISHETVLASLPAHGLAAFVDLADVLDAVPWDVLAACRALVRRHLAREGTGAERGCFGRPA
ncbi:MAG: DUF6527 family protein [Pseudomonadota bacterium]